MRHLRHLSDVLVSRNWYKTESKLYQNVYLCIILYKIPSIKQIIFNKYANILKTTIFQMSLRNSSLLILLCEFNSFSFLIDIVNNIIYASGICHQNSNQWHGSIIAPICITWPVYCTAIGGSSCHLHIHFGIILTQFYVNFSRQEHQIDVF